ncbi:hypothetical protein N7470_007024 [Penicillium chermesinum]|nr:hypothetical protein N7470_007024 [Penicillium chermesinum]
MDPFRFSSFHAAQETSLELTLPISMERVVVVGAGLYGLIAAKTYFQVKEAYSVDTTPSGPGAFESVPSGFTTATASPVSESKFGLLIIDAASDIGGTWAEERLYPNLSSQDSYGMYEYSDMPLAVNNSPGGETDDFFIPGWKINRYLHEWVDKWALKQSIPFAVFRREKWNLRICITHPSESYVEIFCDKLILATGLTSEPHFPEGLKASLDADVSRQVIHAKDIGAWSRQNLGYQPFAGNKRKTEGNITVAGVTSVAVYGGAKSAFDLVHFFATLHQNGPVFNLRCSPHDPVQVHWIIRDHGTGPSWMVPPTSSLPTGEVVASDKASSMRIFHYLSACSYEIPKRLTYGSWKLYTEGSWLARLFHGNPLGRWWTRSFWNSVEKGLEEFAGYSTESKMQLLRPAARVSDCGAIFGIANQPDLWKAIQSPNVKVYRSSIVSITKGLAMPNETQQQSVVISLENGTRIEGLDLVTQATGYEPIVPIQFEPPSFRLTLGLSGNIRDDTSNPQSQDFDCTNIPLDAKVSSRMQHWKSIDKALEPKVRRQLSTTGCQPPTKPQRSNDLGGRHIPYRLFRRMVAPELVAAGDRSFVAMGLLTTSKIAIVAEVQALWAVAFLMGEFDGCSGPSNKLSLPSVSVQAMEQSISEDFLVGHLTLSGLSVDPIEYNDLLLRDLGINPNRLGGFCVKELTGVYQPSVYRGIVAEWLAKRKSPGKFEGKTASKEQK